MIYSIIFVCTVCLRFWCSWRWHWACVCLFGCSERTWPMKVEQIRAQMRDNPYKPTAVLLSALDETACKHPKAQHKCWRFSLNHSIKLFCGAKAFQFASLFSGLFNLRGNDIPFNPFFYSYTLLSKDEIWQVLPFHINSTIIGVQFLTNLLCQAVCAQWTNNRWVEGVPECFVLPGLLCAAAWVQLCANIPEVLSTETQHKGVGGYRVHQPSPVWAHHSWGKT